MSVTGPPRDERAILVVDDEELNRDLLLRRLGRAGYRAEAACDAREALEKIARNGYELVLLDSMMPEMSGVDLLRLLRGTYSPSELPVIMVTALQESEKVVEALSLGANDYITKPLDFPVALARIKSHLERKKAEEALRESQERLSLAAQGANDGIWDWDLRTGRIFLSARWKEMLGLAPDEAADDTPETWLSRVHHDDEARLRRDLESVRLSHGPAELVNEHRLRHGDGSWHWFLARATVLRGPGGEALRMVGSQTDVTREKAFDPLTGLPNRILFTEMLDRAIGNAGDGPGGEFAVLYADLDRFKVVNDSLGHAAGDRLLREVAARLDLAAHTWAQGAAADSMVARLGGDEFGILVSGVADATRARAIAAFIQEHLHASFEIDGQQTFTSSSIGIALSGSMDRAEGAAGLIRDADTAMYEAKRCDKGGAAVFTLEMRARAQRRLDLETGLQLALERQQFEVYYQPKIDLATGQLAGMEALLRWRHPTRGMVAPSEFVPIAEETGLIVPIGQWVLREACARTRLWHDENPEGPPLTISVNLSVRQFQQKDLASQIRTVLEETGFAPRFLCLEVTESVLAGDPQEASRLLEALAALGIGLEIDDFGTGYSSLNYLASLPFDTIKIDRSFVANMLACGSAFEVIKVILALARALGKQVVAEGIETAEQLERLRALGCHLGQGYYFAAPMPPDEILPLIRKRNRLASEWPPAAIMEGR